MLSLKLCIWIIAVVALLCLTVFPGKRKILQDEDVVTDAAKNIMVVSMTLMLIMYPIFSGNTWGHHKYYELLAEKHPDVVSRYLKTIRYLRIERHDDISFDLSLGVYALVILCSVFLFFTGMYVYKNGIKIRHKMFLILPVVMSVIGVAYQVSLYDRLWAKDPSNLVLSMIFGITEYLIEYLMSTAVMIVILYLIYKVLKMVLRNELIPLIIILILSFFPSEYELMQGAKEYDLLKLVWGANIPLFPVGMLVMKYKDKLLPKAYKQTIIWSIVWTVSGAASLMILLSHKGPGISGAREFCLTDSEITVYSSSDDILINRISVAMAIPWLILGLAIVMLFLNIALRIKTGNKFTLFLRKHLFIVLILHLCNYIRYYSFFTDCVKDLLSKVKIENAFITSVVWMFIYFGIAVVLKRCVTDRIGAKGKA